MKEEQKMDNNNELVKHEYLEKVFNRLKDEGFKITEDVNHGYLNFKHVAKRTRFEFEKFGFIETYFIFDELTESDIIPLRKYSKACTEYAIAKSRVPLPRGFGKGIVCYSVAFVYGVDQTTVKAIQTEDPPKHWATFEIPIVCDLSDSQLYYFEKTPSWGSLYWDHFRETICSILAP